MAGQRTITQPANNSSLDSSVVRNQLQLIENEVASDTSIDPGHLHTAAGLDTTGTPSSTTFLNGDFEWAEPDFGSVKSVSVVTANGLAGSVGSPTINPAITISTTVVGLVKANGVGFSAAVAGTDYQVPVVLTTIGSGGPATFNGTTLNIPNYSSGGGGSGTVTEVDTGTGLTGGPITTTGTIEFATDIAPIATIGTALQQIRVNAGATALEYFTPSSSGLTIGSTTITSGTTTRVLFDNSGVLGEYSISGTGNVAMTTSPSFTTPNIGVATATSINGLTITASTGVITITNGKTLSVTNSLTLSGTDSTTMTFPTTTATIARTDAAQTFTGIQTFSTPIAATSVATMTATVGGGVPTPPNNTTTFLRGDGTFATPSGGGNISNTGTPLDNQIAVWTSSTVIEGTTGLTYDGSNFQLTGDIGSTGTRITKGWFTDLTVTNAIAGSITGNAATVSSANEATDTSCFPLFITASGTQTLATKNNAGFIYNSNTNALTATTFIGALTGNADTTTTATTATNAVNIGTATESTDTTCFPVFVTASGTQTLPGKTNTTLTYNSNTNDLGVTKINGLTMTASTGTFTLTNAKTISVTNTLTLSGTDSTTMTFPTTSATIARTDAANTFTGTQTIGALVATTINGNTFTTGTGVLTIAAAKTLTANNSITLAGTDSTTMTFPTTTATIARTDAGQTFTGTQILAENASIQLDPAGSADGKFTGVTVTAVSDYSQAFGDLVYLKASNSRWAAADADAATTAGPVALAMVVVTGTSGNACTLLLQGIIRADAKFPTMTVGATQYVGEAAGEIQGAIPTGADNIIRTVGYALTADELYFAPSTDWSVTVA